MGTPLTHFATAVQIWNREFFENNGRVAFIGIVIHKHFVLPVVRSDYEREFFVIAPKLENPLDLEIKALRSYKSLRYAAIAPLIEILSNNMHKIAQKIAGRVVTWESKKTNTQPNENSWLFCHYETLLQGSSTLLRNKTGDRFDDNL